MRVALLCPGLGRANRGYERFAAELFDRLAPVMGIELFSARKPQVRTRERRIRSPGRDSWSCKLLGSFSRDKYFWEAAGFAVAAFRSLARFDVIHFSEPPLSLMLPRLMPTSGTQRFLFSHALNMDVEHTLQCHHIHQTSPEAFAAAIARGVPAERMTLLRYGIDTTKFTPVADRAALRREMNLPEHRPIVLSVAALNRKHKRIDALVNAIAGMSDRPHLLLCGSLDEPDLLEEAHRRLAGDFTYISAAPERMPAVYAVADLFVHTAVVEGFGLALLEAHLSGLPVIVNDSPHFRWLLEKGAATFVDVMSQSSLAGSVTSHMKQPESGRNAVLACRDALVRSCDWTYLSPDYHRMYETVASHDNRLISEIVNSA